MSRENYVRHIERKALFEDKKNAFLAKLEEANLSEEFTELEREEEELKQAEKKDWSLYGALVVVIAAHYHIFYWYLIGEASAYPCLSAAAFSFSCAVEFLHQRDGPAERWSKLSWRDVLYAKPQAIMMRTFYWTLATLSYLATVLLIRQYFDVCSAFPCERLLTFIVGLQLRFVIYVFRWQNTA